MKLRSLLPLLISGLALCMGAQAGITDFTYTSDYSNFTCTATMSLNSDRSVGTVAMYGYQYAGHGLMGGNITTDSATDPSLVINGDVDNDTGAAWSGYEINLYMNRNFTLSNVNVSVPAGWTATYTPTTPSSGIYYHPNEFVAHILYSQAEGGPIAPGGEFNFAYTLTFTGSTGYSFTAEMNPIFVPEPSTAGLALLGGLLFAACRRKAARS